MQSSRESIRAELQRQCRDSGPDRRTAEADPDSEHLPLKPTLLIQTESNAI